MISVMWRALVVVAGFAVVAAATHVNVMHRGGYGAIDSWLVIAVSVLLAVGMGFVGTEWQSNRKFGAVVLFVCLLAGEARTRIVAACNHRARPVNERDHVSRFLLVALRPDPTATVSLRQLHKSYPAWCQAQSVDPLTPEVLGQQLRSIVAMRSASSVSGRMATQLRLPTQQNPRCIAGFRSDDSGSDSAAASVPHKP